MNRYLILTLILLPSVLYVFFFGLKTPSCKTPSLNIEKTLATLSKEDREALDWFFHYLNESSAAYVLFGDKPMAICCFQETGTAPSEISQIEDLIDSLFGSLNMSNLRVKKGWETWKKHAHLFPSSNYILQENRNVKHNWVTIVIINKQAFLKKIENNCEDFKKILGSDITPEKILESCLKGNTIFEDVLNCHDGLFGILLGYGRHNAQLFFRKTQIERIRDLQRFTLVKNILLPFKGFPTLSDEYNNISEKLKYFDEGEILDLNPLFMTLPGFMADHHSPETQQLKKRYRKQYKKIINKYKHGEYLEITLSQFCNTST